MPILKREPDLFPPDLLQSERAALELARAALDQVAKQHSKQGIAGTKSESYGESNGDSSTQPPAVIASHDSTAQAARLQAEIISDAGAPTSTELGSTTPSAVEKNSESDDAGAGKTNNNPNPMDLGSFSYVNEYLGVEQVSKPLTFWTGDWDEFQKFDPEAKGWWCLYTHSRHEKVLMRHLLTRQISFYCPMIEKRYRSPQGRMRTSFSPLFANYVFLKGTDDDRRYALSTDCVLASKPVQQPVYFVSDLWQINRALEMGVALTPEQKLTKGDPVVVKSGPFKGFEGFIQRRAGKTRFLIFLRYLEQGVSMEIDEGALTAM